MATWGDFLKAMGQDEDYYRQKFAWQRPAVPGSLQSYGEGLGAAGTIRDIISEGALRPALGAAVYAANVYGANRMPGTGEIAPLRGLTREDLARYLEENVDQRHPLAAFASGVLTDPLSYVGGPVGGIAKAAAGATRAIKPLSSALSAVAKADVAYQKGAGAVTEAIVPAAGAVLKALGKKVPLLKWATDSPLGEWAKYTDALWDAMRSVTQYGEAGKREILGAAVAGTRERLGQATAKQIDAQVAQGWEKIETTVMGTENPAQQAASMNLYVRARQAADEVGKRTYEERQRLMKDPSLQTEITMDGGKKTTEGEYLAGQWWQSRYAEVMGIQRAAGEGIEKLMAPDIDWASLSTGADAASLKSAIEETLVSMKGRRVGAHAAAETIKGKDEEAAALRNTLFRSGESQSLADWEAAQEFISPVVTPEVQKIIDLSDAVTGRGWAGLKGDKAPSALAAISKESAEALTSNADAILAASARITADRNYVFRKAAPALSKHYDDLATSGLIGPEESLRLQEEAFGDSSKLLAALKDAGVETADIEKRLGVGHLSGDLLDGRDLPSLVLQRLGQDKAKGLNIKLPSWFAGGVQVWRELALMSLSYSLSNLVTGLFLSEKNGVPWTRVMRRLGENLASNGDEFRAAIRSGIVLPHQTNADTLPLLRDLGRARGDLITLPGGLAGNLGQDFSAVLGASGLHASETALGRHNPVVSGLIGLGTGAAAYANDPENPAGAVGIGVGVGAGASVVLPRLAAIGRVLSRTIEDALRVTSFYSKVEQGHAGIAKDMSGILGDTPIAAWFESRGGRVSPADILSQATKAGMPTPEAQSLAGAWDGMIGKLEGEGVALSHRINFDYRDVPRIVQFMRETGLMPFLTWQTKALPLFASILMQNPRFIVLIDEYNQLSERETGEAGLPTRFNQTVKLPLGDQIAQDLFGRPGEVWGHPLMALLPVVQQAAMGEALDRGGNAVDKAMAILQAAGFGMSPLVQVPLQAAGATYQQDPTILRTSPYIEALSSAFGPGIDPEAPIKEGVRAIRKATGAKTTDPETPSVAKDAAIRQRIVEIYHEDGHTGRPRGTYAEALSDTKSEIWQRARHDVERSNAAQIGLSASLPIRGRFLSETEKELRAAAKAQGVSGEELGDMPDKEARSQALRAAEARDPRSTALLGTSPEQADWDKWRALKAKSWGLPSAIRQMEERKFLRDNPRFADTLRSFATRMA